MGCFGSPKPVNSISMVYLGSSFQPSILMAMNTMSGLYDGYA